MGGVSSLPHGSQSPSVIIGHRHFLPLLQEWSSFSAPSFWHWLLPCAWGATAQPPSHPRLKACHAVGERVLLPLFMFSCGSGPGPECPGRRPAVWRLWLPQFVTKLGEIFYLPGLAPAPCPLGLASPWSLSDRPVSPSQPCPFGV